MPDSHGLVGQWQLRSRVDLDAAGTRHIDPFLGADPLGFLVFGPTRFAAQFMKRDRGGSIPQTAGTGSANNTAAVNGYDAYFGTYRITPSGNAIETTLEGALSPGNVGQTYTRGFRVSGDVLEILLDTTSAEQVPVKRTLTWDRVG